MPAVPSAAGHWRWASPPPRPRWPGWDSGWRRTRRGTGDGPYPQWGPFELDDGVYLIGPVTRLGGLAGFFVLGALGQIVFSALRLRELWNARPPASPPSLDDPSAREHT